MSKRRSIEDSKDNSKKPNSDCFITNFDDLSELVDKWSIKPESTQVNPTVCEALNADLFNLGVRGWRVQSLLKTGDNATVLGAVSHSNGDKGVIKVHIVDEDENHEDFRREILVHKAFFNLGLSPELHGHYSGAINGVKVTVQIIERFDGTLDEYLVAKKSSEQLSDVVDQLVEILGIMEDNFLTHADLALFNIAYQHDDTRPSGIRLQIFDFDRSHNLRRYFKPGIDIMRVFIELHPDSVTKGYTADMDRSNMQYLREVLRPSVKRLFKQSGDTYEEVKEQLETWDRMYNLYADKTGNFFTAGWYVDDRGNLVYDPDQK